MPQQIQLRRGSTAAWTAADPVLAEGEMAVELDEGAVVSLRVGNGVDAWSELGPLTGGDSEDPGPAITAAILSHDADVGAHDDIRALIAGIEPGAVERVVEQHLPLAIEFAGGEFTGENTALLPAAAENPAGLLVLWSAQADPANVDVWEHQGDGVFHRVVPSWLGADRVGTLIESQFNPLAGGAFELLRVTAPNEFETLVVTEEQVQALIDATEPTDLLAADEDLGYSIAATDAWEPEQWFVHNGETTGRLSTPHPGAFDTGVLMRSVTMLTGVPGGSNRFAEILSEAHDDGGGAWDAFESADHLNNAGSFDTAVPPLGNLPDWLDRWLDFWEHTVDENSTEEDIQLLTTAANVRPGLWISRMKTIDFATGTYRVWREVLHGGDAVTVDTGQRWRLVREVVDERFESIHSLGEDWWVGNNYPGRIAKLDAFDGFTSDDSGDVEEITPGTVLVNPDASQVDPTETTSFTDAAGNVWVMGDATIGQSLRERLAAVEAALDT